MTRIAEESLIQTAVVSWLREEHPDVLICSSMGGIHMLPSARARAKREGYTPGAPDLFIYEPSGGGAYCGLAIEFKTRTGKVAPLQLAWLTALERRGWLAVVSRGVEDAKEFITAYLTKIK